MTVGAENKIVRIQIPSWTST